ncbi:ATP-binding cassette domain-containing protein [Nocardia sp. NPDC050799]|uniref:ATP-binding cassette domain-containing protein n=1 Tax=Nocardia sp. NPDC050799 TaxID=3154842 RepID=UPI0033E2D296
MTKTMNNGRSPAIRAAGLGKSYGDEVVLDGVDITVPEGAIYSLLGPNGAAETSIVQIPSTLIAADAGDIRVGGHDPATDPTPPVPIPAGSPAGFSAR